MTIRDQHDRTISYLRLSVTDRCNLRCLYCTPPASKAAPEYRGLLSFDDLFRIAEVSVTLGMRKIRVTGGEPLTRPGIVQFLERVHGIEGIGELVLTTNGMLLSRMAKDLHEAGVKRLNISLDSLRSGRFAQLTGGGSLDKLLAGIEAAREAGFPPPQLNTVIMRGFNEDEISDFAALSERTGMAVRFIEYMPVNADPKWRDSFFSCAEMLDVLSRQYDLLPEEQLHGAGPARYYKLGGTQGKIGVISPISKHFCAHCNRLRITADGFARSCLFSSQGADLRPFLSQDNEALRKALTAIVHAKPASHNLTPDLAAAGFVPMSAIGG